MLSTAPLPNKNGQDREPMPPDTAKGATVYRARHVLFVFTTKRVITEPSRASALRVLRESRASPRSPILGIEPACPARLALALPRPLSTFYGGCCVSLQLPKPGRPTTASARAMPVLCIAPRKTLALRLISRTNDTSASVEVFFFYSSSALAGALWDHRGAIKQASLRS